MFLILVQLQQRRAEDRRRKEHSNATTKLTVEGVGDVTSHDDGSIRETDSLT